VLAVAVFGYTLRGGLNILDSDHVIAFVIGVGLVVALPRRERTTGIEPATLSLGSPKQVPT